MSLVDELAKLHEVQKVDVQLYQREMALKALDSGEALKQQAIGLMKRHDVAKSQLQQLESSLKDRELELKSIEKKRATVHEKLYSGRVTNPKELGDLEKDEKMLDDQIGHIEEAVLELMDQVESSRTIEDALNVETAAARRKWQETVAHTQAETARIQKEIADLRPEREKLAAQVEKPLLRRYDEIRQRREGIGMTVTGSDTCPACHIKLSPQLLERLREGEELTQCDNCSRILAWQPAIDKAKQT